MSSAVILFIFLLILIWKMLPLFCFSLTERKRQKWRGTVCAVLYVLVLYGGGARRPIQASQKRADPVYPAYPPLLVVHTYRPSTPLLGRGERGRVSEDVYSPL